jgi:hypothetical protein
MERENLAGDGKGKGTSGSNREAESTDAPERGGLPCSSSSRSRMLLQMDIQVERATVRQKKTGQPVRFELTEQTRQTIDEYMKAAGA